jgi:hypothetical protein
LRNDDIKKVVESAIDKLSNPIKVKEQLVCQLKTQVVDLERFIDFLQGEATSPGPYGDKQKAAKCDCNRKSGIFSFDVSPSWFEGVGALCALAVSIFRFFKESDSSGFKKSENKRPIGSSSSADNVRPMLLFPEQP